MSSAKNGPENEQELIALLDREVQAYRNDDSLTHSPIWIWFTKSNSEESYCLICKKSLVVRHGSTSSLMTHLKRVHNHSTSYNASVIWEELAELKELRLTSLRSQRSETSYKNRVFRKLLNKERKRLQSVLDRSTTASTPHPHQTPKRVKGVNDGGRKIMGDLVNVEGKHEIDEDLFEDEEEEIAQGEIFHSPIFVCLCFSYVFFCFVFVRDGISFRRGL